MANPLTPEQIAAAGTEHAHQTAFFAWAATARLTYPELRSMFAIPNGGFRNAVTAARLKAEGVKPGVPDVFLPASRPPYHGLFLEFKKPKKGQISGFQAYWIDLLSEAGFEVQVVAGWTAAQIAVCEYLNRPKVAPRTKGNGNE